MNRVALDLGFIQIYWYSLCIMAGMLIGMYLVFTEARKKGIGENTMTNLVFYTVIVSIIGARLYYVIFNWSYYSKNTFEILEIWNGGLAIHGAIILGGIFLIAYVRNRRLDVLKVLDICSVGLIIGQAIGRWGNFFNQEAYGPVVSLKFLQGLHLPKFIIDGMFINGNYYQPTFLYESLWCLIGFIILMVVRRRKYIKTGQIFGLYCMWYSLGRGVIESLRQDSLMLGPIKMAQIVSVLMFLVGLYFFIRRFRAGRFEFLYNEEKVETVSKTFKGNANKVAPVKPNKPKKIKSAKKSKLSQIFKKKKKVVEEPKTDSQVSVQEESQPSKPDLLGAIMEPQTEPVSSDSQQQAQLIDLPGSSVDISQNQNIMSQPIGTPNNEVMPNLMEGVPGLSQSQDIMNQPVGAPNNEVMPNLMEGVPGLSQSQDIMNQPAVSPNNEIMPNLMEGVPGLSQSQDIMNQPVGAPNNEVMPNLMEGVPGLSQSQDIMNQPIGAPNNEVMPNLMEGVPGLSQSQDIMSQPIGAPNNEMIPNLMGGTSINVPVAQQPAGFVGDNSGNLPYPNDIQNQLGNQIQNQADSQNQRSTGKFF